MQLTQAFGRVRPEVERNVDRHAAQIARSGPDTRASRSAFMPSAAATSVSSSNGEHQPRRYKPKRASYEGGNRPSMTSVNRARALFPLVAVFTTDFPL
jgi:hypothetical protein